MKYQKSLLAASAILSLTAVDAQAALSSYNPSGVDLVYSSISDITWTKDANLLGTLESTLGFDTVVNAIIAASPTINDTRNTYDTPNSSGHHNVTGSDFTPGGHVNWFGAKAFISYLNSVNYAGSNQWALPSAGTSPVADYNQTNTQFGGLFYNELNGTAGNNIPINTNFSNQQRDAYWLATELTGDASIAWRFHTEIGYQGNAYKNNPGPFAWAVTPGQVAAVPVPAAAWLFGSALLGFASLKRRGLKA